MVLLLLLLLLLGRTVRVLGVVALARHDSAAQLAWTLFGGGCLVVIVGAALLAVAMRRHRAGDLLVSGLMPGSTDPDADIERDVHPGR